MSKNLLIKLLFGAVLISALSGSDCTQQACLIKAFERSPTKGVHRLIALNPDFNVAAYRTEPSKLQVLSNHHFKPARALLAEFYLAQKQYHLVPSLIDDTLAQAQLLAELYFATEQYEALARLPISSASAQLQLIATMTQGSAVTRRLQQLHTSPLFSFNDVQPQHCKDNILTIVTSWESYQAAKAIISDFNHRYSLDICFSKPVYIARSHMPCAVVADMARCRITNLAQQLPRNGFTKLVVVTERGQANAGNGVVHLNKHQSANVLLHELMHLYHFIDEYPLPDHHAKRFCNVTKTRQIAHNMVVSNEYHEYLQWQGKRWYPSNSCAEANAISYKPVAQISNMELLDLSLPNDYLSILNQVIEEGGSDNYQSYFNVPQLEPLTAADVPDITAL